MNTQTTHQFENYRYKIGIIDLVLFCLMVYQPIRVIKCQINSNINSSISNNSV